MERVLNMEYKIDKEKYYCRDKFKEERISYFKRIFYDITLAQNGLMNLNQFGLAFKLLGYDFNKEKIQ